MLPVTGATRGPGPGRRIRQNRHPPGCKLSTRHRSHGCASAGHERRGGHCHHPPRKAGCPSCTLLRRNDCRQFSDCSASNASCWLPVHTHQAVHSASPGSVYSRGMRTRFSLPGLPARTTEPGMQATTTSQVLWRPCRPIGRIGRRHYAAGLGWCTAARSQAKRSSGAGGIGRCCTKRPGLVTPPSTNRFRLHPGGFIHVLLAATGGSFPAVVSV